MAETTKGASGGGAHAGLDLEAIRQRARLRRSDRDALVAEVERLRAALGHQLSYEEEVAKGHRLYGGIPVKEMIDRAWIRADDVDDPRVPTELARFFGVATIEDVYAMIADQELFRAHFAQSQSNPRSTP